MANKTLMEKLQILNAVLLRTPEATQMNPISLFQSIETFNVYCSFSPVGQFVAYWFLLIALPLSPGWSSGGPPTQTDATSSLPEDKCSKTSQSM